MISYSLALELKEAGWIQPVEDGLHKGEFLRAPWPRPDLPSKEIAYAPSLSELIEACPRKHKVDMLESDAEGFFCLHWLDDDDWLAGYIYFGAIPLNEHGASPAEAIARLWLSLQAQAGK